PATPPWQDPTVQDGHPPPDSPQPAPPALPVPPTPPWSRPPRTRRSSFPHQRRQCRRRGDCAAGRGSSYGKGNGVSCARAEENGQSGSRAIPRPRCKRKPDVAAVQRAHGREPQRVEIPARGGGSGWLKLKVEFESPGQPDCVLSAGEVLVLPRP